MSCLWLYAKMSLSGCWQSSNPWQVSSEMSAVWDLLEFVGCLVLLSISTPAVAAAAADDADADESLINNQIWSLSSIFDSLILNQLWKVQWGLTQDLNNKFIKTHLINCACTQDHDAFLLFRLYPYCRCNLCRRLYTILLINLKYFADLRKDCFKRSFLSQVFDVGTLVGVQSITGVQLVHA